MNKTCIFTTLPKKITAVQDRRGVYQVFSQNAEIKSLCWCSGYRKRTGQCRRPCSSRKTWAPVTSLELRPSRLSCEMAAEADSSSSSLSEPGRWGLGAWNSLIPRSWGSQRQWGGEWRQVWTVWSVGERERERNRQTHAYTLTFIVARRVSFSLSSFFSLALAFLASLSAAL